MSYLTEQMSGAPSVGMTTVIVDSNQPIIQSGFKPWVMGFILSIAACLIISTNLLVAAALLKLLLKKKNQSWCFVLNLALADILVGVAITGLATEDFNTRVTQSNVTIGPFTTAAPPGFPDRTRCLLRMACLTSPCMASILSMFLISLDRYVAIKMPLRYSLLSGKPTAAGSLLVLWITSLTTGFLPVMVQQLQARDAYDGFCAFFSVMDDIGNIVLYSTLFFPVLALFIYMYLDILKIACSHQKQISQVSQASSRSADIEQGHHHHYLHNSHQHLQLRNSSWSHVKALRTVAVLVGCFLLLWCPFFVVCIVHILCKSCGLKEVLENYLWLLGLSNSLINPLVYAFWQREVRLQLAAMFSCVTGMPAAAAPPGVTERCHPLVQTQTCVSEVVNFKGQAVPLSATTSV
ncbi:glucose-dependent insulinotropic receptor [Xenentodon cancila]